MMPKKGSNYEQNHYAVVIVKELLGVLKIKVVGHWPIVITYIYFFSEVHGNTECTITGARCYSSDSPQGRLEMPCSYTALFMVMQKLGRSYTLSVSKILINININGINLT